MENYPTRKISAILSSEKKLEKVIEKISPKIVSKQHITIQGNPSEMAEKFGKEYPPPQQLQHRIDSPKKEPFLRDDRGWMIGFSFAIPFFICVVIGVFIIGDIRSYSDNILYGLAGGIIGGLLGLALAYTVNKIHEKKINKQEKVGGFVIWIAISDDIQYAQISKILKKYGAFNITLSYD